ncbi:MAG: ABC transporter permease [Solirubrobacteraceae bacterium]|nr:ABC transporter permease [Solirubrobacteraceae bacterium]
MSALVASELLKLRTTRTFYGVTGAAAGIILLIVILTSALAPWEAGDQPLLSALGVAGFVQIFALVIGILAVSTEVRHGTITPSLLAVPNRVRFIGSKFIANGVAGLLLGLVTSLLCWAFAAGIFSARGIDSEAGSGELLQAIIGNGIASALFAILGVGLGALIRNQAGAIVAALVYMLVIENLLGAIPGLDEFVPQFGINGSSTALTAGSDDFSVDNQLGQIPGGLVFAAWAALFAAAGTAMLRRRDVS